MATKNYKKKLDLARTLETLQYGETIEVTNEEYSFNSISQSISRILSDGKLPGFKLSVTKDNVNKIAYITRFHNIDNNKPKG